MLIPTKFLLTLSFIVVCFLGKNEKSPKQLLQALAVRTGLEPATPCVTGMYSNQLNYRTSPCCFR